MHDHHKSLREHLLQVVAEMLAIHPDLSDEQTRAYIERLVFEQGKTLIAREKKDLIDRIFAAFRGLDVLQKWMDDRAVTEIMVNRWDCIFIERNGEMIKTSETFESPEKLNDFIQMLVSHVNRAVNERTPIVDVRWRNHVRVNVVLPPVALDGAVVTFRKFPTNAFSIQQLVQLQFLTDEIADLLSKQIRARSNILIGGGTSSGKTTLLNALIGEIPITDRVVTAEDSAELSMHNVANYVRLETKNANIDGEGEIPLRQLIRTALRMRPDRIIVGEVRGHEAFDMLQAMNTGHDGSMSTAHANSSVDMLTRLEMMVISAVDIPIDAVRHLICSAIDVFIHVAKRNGTRKIVEICELNGVENGQYQMKVLYQWNE
jgi:pilus assembly protein CpaF